MNSPVRATADLKADPADATILRLTHTENVIAEMCRDATALEKRSSELAPLDLATVRMRALAERVASARRATRQLPVPSDAAFTAVDTEIMPVSRTAIAGLRALRAADAGDEEGTLAVLPGPKNERSALPEPATTSDSIASDNAITTAVAADAEPPPVALRLAPAPLAAPHQQPTDVDFVASAPDNLLPALLDTTGPDQLLERLGHLPPPSDAPPGDDQPPTDIRLVDLIRRQQTLLEQLNSYPGTPATPAAHSVVEQLAPTPAQIAQIAESQPPDEVDEPAPEAASDNIATPQQAPALVSAVPAADPPLTERAPMIIERARAERSGRLARSDAYNPPSAIPAFAAGLTIALAIAGTLLYLL